MKFVYFGYDFMLPAIMRLTKEGHELIGIFSFECDNIFNFNRECQNVARHRSIPLIMARAEDFHLNEFIDKGTEIFLSAGYPYKIPPIDEDKAFAVNVHPTRLPKARGVMPIPRIILDNIKDAAGFTAHKMTQEFDAGDILLQEKFDLGPTETVETYSSKIAIRAPDMFAELINNLPELWKNAKAQNEKKATSIKPPKDEERFLNWEQDVLDIDRTGRAFGQFGSLARFNNQVWVVYNYDFWEEKHELKPGSIAAAMGREVVIAAKNGFICLKNFQPVKTG